MADLEKLIEELSQLTVMEAADLVKQLEENGVSAQLHLLLWLQLAVVMPVAVLLQKKNPEFDVILASVPGDKKIAVIKAIREVKAGLGLADAKKVAEGAPAPLLEGVSMEEAEEAKKKLEAAGATAELK